MARIRLDKLLMKRNFASTEEQSQELISTGVVLVNGAVQTSPASFVDSGSAIELVGPKLKYVSRGGFKLEKALEVFSIDLTLRRCLDVGASTGGFTDCMLQSGASHVVAVDVGRGQLDNKIRHHDQVTILEKFNARDLTIDAIGGACEFAGMDVSFTSILGLLPAVMSVLSRVEMAVLIKPQFEVEEKYVNTKGIVQDPDIHASCIRTIRDSLPNDIAMAGFDYSPLAGTKGNIEFLAHLVSGTGKEIISDSRIESCVASAHNEIKGNK